MMQWFETEHDLKTWGGPGFHYPFDRQTFTADLKINDLASFSLLSDRDEFVGFGQYYLRLGKCHLGRLVVSPEHRGKGVGYSLLQKLTELGTKALKVKSSSLFVLDHNVQAIKLYKRFGFIIVDYPEKIPLAHCLYMTK